MSDVERLTDKVIDVFREWITDQCNRYGVTMPGDDWPHYDTGRLRRMVMDELKEVNDE